MTSVILFPSGYLQPAGMIAGGSYVVSCSTAAGGNEVLDEHAYVNSSHWNFYTLEFFLEGMMPFSDRGGSIADTFMVLNHVK